MNKIRHFIWPLGLLLFVAAIIAAIMLKSSKLIYVASVLPLFIVPFLPDMKFSQYLKANPTKGMTIVRLSGSVPSDSDLVVISFNSGQIRWGKKKLYFSLADIPNVDRLPAQDNTISFPILNYDLDRHPRRSGWVGIRLDQIRHRAKSLPFSLKEVNRIVIRMIDLQPYLTEQVTGTPIVSQNKQMQA